MTTAVSNIAPRLWKEKVFARTTGAKDRLQNVLDRLTAECKKLEEERKRLREERALLKAERAKKTRASEPGNSPPKKRAWG